MMVRAMAAAVGMTMQLCVAGACMAAPDGKTAPDARTAPVLRYLDAAEFAPERLVPAPPAPDSATLTRELAHVREVIALASPERKAQAAADAAEDPAAFNGVLGFDLKTRPRAYALLVTIADETAAVIVPAKVYFHLPRPYQIDPALPHCGKGGDAPRAYPSGHAAYGYSLGWALARLLPARAPQILARASDYAFSREVCGVHFHADTDASRVIGTLVADRLLSDPRLAADVAAARAELAAP